MLYEFLLKLGLNKEATTIATDSSVGAIVPTPANDDHNRKTTGSVEMESPPPHPMPPRATQRVLTFVPTDTSTLRELVSQSLDIYWNLRRFGESWVDQPAPHSFLISCQSRKSSDGTNDVVMTSSLMPCEVTFRRMIFEYIGEVLIDIYSREDSVCCEGNDQLQSYNHAGLFTGPVKYLAYKNYNLKRRLATKKLPHILDELKPIVIDLILSSLPNQFKSTMASATTKTSKMDHNKKDFVEQLLARDLRVEEEGWIDYDDDVEDVKTAAFESLYQTLLDETLSTVSRVFDKSKHNELNFKMCINVCINEELEQSTVCCTSKKISGQLNLQPGDAITIKGLEPRFSQASALWMSVKRKK
ncbi:hypothetical protein HELRODRAFT_166940 [Helobdella robusta]|uniref:Uncharacterized protein n=1 Tax=Helobdella robusta TaxID=6412 RepID=T1EYS3_HELRO|nr:hypothetical protein HELRODRAFT_166940 [Helobdella robusta]ESO11864.1 hypothetical protein HELRODRAFT_166940 [Helobdella robusta]